MRILHIHEKFWPYMGGSTTRLLNLISESDMVHYVLARKHTINLAKVSKVGRVRVIRYKTSIELLRLLCYLCVKKDFDVYHVHNLRAAFFFLPFLWAKNFLRKGKVILELHSVYFPSSKFKRWVSKKAVSCYANILLLSDRSICMLEAYYGVKNKNIAVVENGISLKDFRYNRNVKGSIKICYVGSLKAFQGLEKFVSIANSVVSEKVEFHVFGGTEGEIHSLKMKDRNKQVNFHGVVEYAAVPKIYSEMDVLLMTRPKMKSTDSAIPIKPIEALGVGLDVFSTNVGGMCELQSKIIGRGLTIFDSTDALIDAIENYSRGEGGVTDVSYFSRVVQRKKLEIFYASLQ